MWGWDVEHGCAQRMPVSLSDSDFSEQGLFECKKCASGLSVSDLCFKAGRKHEVKGISSCTCLYFNQEEKLGLDTSSTPLTQTLSYVLCYPRQGMAQEKGTVSGLCIAQLQYLLPCPTLILSPIIPVPLLALCLKTFRPCGLLHTLMALAFFTETKDHTIMHRFE